MNYQRQALACVDELLDYCSCETLAFKIFQALIAISAFCEEAEGLREHVSRYKINEMQKIFALTSRLRIFEPMLIF